METSLKMLSCEVYFVPLYHGFTQWDTTSKQKTYVNQYRMAIPDAHTSVPNGCFSISEVYGFSISEVHGADMPKHKQQIISSPWHTRRVNSRTCLDVHHTAERVKSASTPHLHKLYEHCQTMVQTEATYIHPARIELATFSV